ncbi:MAG: hypothetical protein ABEK03_11290 [Candidatus Bipolaricaulia bacterium]
MRQADHIILRRWRAIDEIPQSVLGLPSAFHPIEPLPLAAFPYAGAMMKQIFRQAIPRWFLSRTVERISALSIGQLGRRQAWPTTVI